MEPNLLEAVAVKLSSYFLFVVSTLVTCLHPGTSVAAAQDDSTVQPYVVYVAREGEHTRCGPDESHYKSDPLRAGQELEVYLETDNDWLGIRPPENSFCWLQSDQVEVADDDITGTIMDGSAYSWIGTHLGKARKYSWQVRLDVGEQVTIIGTARRDGPDGEEFWYRIVPPAGEFRWVHRSQVVDSLDEVERVSPTPLPNRAVAQRTGPDRSGADRSDGADRNDSSGLNRPSVQSTAQASPAAPQDQRVARDNLDALLLDDPMPEDAPVGSGLAASARPTPPSSTQNDDLDNSAWVGSGATASAQSRESAVLAAGYSSQSDASRAEVREHIGGVAQAVGTTPPVLRSVMPEGESYRPQVDLASANVESLQLELSRAMAAGATAIEINGLRERCSLLSTNSADAVNRGRAALLLRRIEDYQRVAMQRNAVASSIAQTAATGPIANASIGDSVGTSAATGVETRFDRQGWLVKVYSARPDAPPYAVTDSAGRTLSYVTPVPGINLRRYLNQEVGLYGRLAFDTSLETPHLIAEQAVRLRR